MRYKAKESEAFIASHSLQPRREELTSLRAEDEFEFTFSPNRRELAFTSTKWTHDAILINGLK